MALKLEHCELFDRQKGVRHFFSTVEGGCSEGNYASLNLGAYCGDKPENVEANRMRLCQELGIEKSRLIIPREVHKEGICLIDEEFLLKDEEARGELLSQSDGLITRLPNVCLGITTADCVPVLLYAQKAEIIAALHAGWRGIACEIVPKAIKILLSMGADPSEIIACTGPCISRKNYQVGDELINEFAKIFRPNECDKILFASANGTHADLRQAVKIQLENLGISAENIALHPGCTYSDEHYFSARRQGLQSGRMVSGVMRR